MKHILAAIIVVVSVSNSWTAVLSGRATVSGYMWERSEADSSETQHLQNTGTLGLRLSRIGGNDLEIATTLRGTYDNRNQGDNLDDYRVYDLFARWRNLAGAANVGVGRHRQSWPTGSVAIDGVSADLAVYRGWELGGYFGSLAPEDGHFKSTDFDEGHAFGGRVGYRSADVGTLFLIYSERRQSRSYGELDVNTLASRNFGLDWRRPISGFGSLYGHLLYDQIREQIPRAQLNARWDVSRSVSLQGEYRYRRPNIAYNSIFWVFGESEYQEGRLRLYWRPSRRWTLSGGVALIDVSGDDGQRFDLGVSHKYFSLSLHGKDGAAGTTLGVLADVAYPINTAWMVRGGANYSSYELIEDQPESNSEAAVWGGLRWQALARATIDLEAQYLTQDITTIASFAGDESDVRIIGRLSWWFFQRLGGQGGTS